MRTQHIMKFKQTTADKSNITTWLQGHVCQAPCFPPWQMPTSVLLTENLLSNYTMKKKCPVWFWISKPLKCALKKKVWHWSSKTYLKQPLRQKGYFENWHEIKYANWIEAKTILGWDTARTSVTKHDMNSHYWVVRCKFLVLWAKISNCFWFQFNKKM